MASSTLKMASQVPHWQAPPQLGPARVRAVFLATMLLVVLLVLLTAQGAHGGSVEGWQSLDGSDNNVATPTLGTVGSTLITAFPDNEYLFLVKRDGGTRPAPERDVSNNVMRQSVRRSSPTVSAFATAWAEFVSHDILDVRRVDGPDTIIIPRGDPVLDPLNRGNRTVSIGEIVCDEMFMPINYQTSWLDASVVYGTDSARLAMLRAGSAGKLYFNQPTGLPWNTDQLSMDGFVDQVKLLAAGDHRANRNPWLVALQGLLVLNHNWWCDQLAVAHPDWSDERLFQEARRRVRAELQIITETEFLPAVLGQVLPPYSGYNATLDPAVSMEYAFVAAAFRHTAAPGVFKRVQMDGQPSSQGDLLNLRSMYNPYYLRQSGIDEILCGMVSTFTPVVLGIDESLRSYYPFYVDLFALELATSRQQGLPKYIELRRRAGLDVPVSFADISGDLTVATNLQRAYSTIAEVDAVTGALAEDPLPGALVGPLTAAIFLEQFLRTRASDRFWYANNQFTPAELHSLTQVRLSTIISRSIPTIPRFPAAAFFATNSFNFGATNTDLPAIGLTDYGTMYHSPISLSWRPGQQFSFILRLSSPGCGPAWLGVGFGDSMRLADVTLCTFDGQYGNCDDRHSTGYSMPVTDVSIGGVNDVVFRSVSCVEGVIEWQYSRAAQPADPIDKQFRDEATSFIAAWSVSGSGGVGYHAANRITATINVYHINDGTLVMTESQPFVAHGIGMSLMWGVFVPIGILWVRYFRHTSAWLSMHALIMMAVSIFTVMFGIIGISFSQPGLSHAHDVLGVVLIGAVMAQVIMGVCLRLWFTSNTTSPTKYRFLRLGHRGFGYAMAICSFAQLLLGIEQLSIGWAWLYRSWVSLVILSFFVAELSYRVFDFRQRKRVRPPLDCIAEMSLENFRMHVAVGRKWVVVDDFIFNVEDFIYEHPGGAYVLRHLIGKDVSEMFHGKISFTPSIGAHRHTWQAQQLLRRMVVAHLVTAPHDRPESGGTFLLSMPGAHDGNPVEPNFLAMEHMGADPLASFHDMSMPDPYQLQAATASSGSVPSTFSNAGHLPTPGPRRRLAVDDSSVADPTEVHPLPNHQPALFYKWTVLSVQALTGDDDSRPVRLLRLAPPPELAHMMWFGAQYLGKSVQVQVLSDAGQLVRGSMALSHYTDSIEDMHTPQPGAISLVVRHFAQDQVSDQLCNLREGDIVSLSMPEGPGLGIRPNMQGTFVGMAQGIGVVPFLDLVDLMARLSGPPTLPDGKEAADYESGLIDTGLPRNLRVVLLVSYCTLADAICLDWLEAAAQRAPDRLQVFVHVKRAERDWVAESPATRSSGPLDDTILRRALSSAQRPIRVRICGRKAFSDTASAVLSEFDVADSMVERL